jgi:tetratricopeptide (TPR) repeat protein
MHCTTLAALLTAAALNGDDAATVLNQKGQRLLQRGRLPEAARTFARAASLAASDLASAMILRNEALAVLKMGDSKAARQLAEQAMSLAENTVGGHDPHLTPVLNTLAEIAIEEQRLEEAASLLDRAIQIGPAAGAHYATALHNRGMLHPFRSESTNPGGLLERALSLRRSLLGADHPSTALTELALKQSRRQRTTAHKNYTE